MTAIGPGALTMLDQIVDQAITAATDDPHSAMSLVDAMRDAGEFVADEVAALAATSNHSYGWLMKKARERLEDRLLGGALYDGMGGYFG